jgi:hypothetical protein
VQRLLIFFENSSDKSTNNPLASVATVNTNVVSNQSVKPITDSADFSIRRHKIIETVKENMIGYSSKEVVIPKKGFSDRLKLVFNFSKLTEKVSTLDSVYIKYQNVARRKFL